MRLWLELFAASTAASAGGAAEMQFWQTGTTASGTPVAVANGDDEKTPLLRFECTPDEVVATAYGATHLRDPESGEEIGDAPGSEMKGSAAQMALITDTVNAHWVWAESAPNPQSGWDLTIRIPLDHPGLLAFPRAKMIALATPGGATAAVVEKGDRKRLAEFVRQCRGGAASR